MKWNFLLLLLQSLDITLRNETRSSLISFLDKRVIPFGILLGRVFVYDDLQYVSSGERQFGASLALEFPDANHFELIRVDRFLLLMFGEFFLVLGLKICSRIRREGHSVHRTNVVRLSGGDLVFDFGTDQFVTTNVLFFCGDLVSEVLFLVFVFGGVELQLKTGNRRSFCVDQKIYRLKMMFEALAHCVTRHRRWRWRNGCVVVLILIGWISLVKTGRTDSILSFVLVGDCLWIQSKLLRGVS